MTSCNHSPSFPDTSPLQCERRPCSNFKHCQLLLIKGAVYIVCGLFLFPLGPFVLLLNAILGWFRQEEWKIMKCRLGYFFPWLWLLFKVWLKCRVLGSLGIWIIHAIDPLPLLAESANSWMKADNEIFPSVVHGFYLLRTRISRSKFVWSKIY